MYILLGILSFKSSIREFPSLITQLAWRLYLLLTAVSSSLVTSPEKYTFEVSIFLFPAVLFKLIFLLGLRLVFDLSWL